MQGGVAGGGGGGRRRGYAGAKRGGAGSGGAGKRGYAGAAREAAAAKDEEEDEKEELMTASMDGVIGNVFPDIGTLFVLETFDNRQIDIERTLVSSLFNLRTFATLV